MKLNKLLNVQRLVVGQMQSNCYLIFDSNTHEVIVVDPGEDDTYIIEKIQQLDLKPLMIIATHGHFDHILAALSIQKTYHIPFAIHENDRFLVGQMASSAKYFLGFDTYALPPMIDKRVQAGDRIKIGSHVLEVIESPGHTPGSITLIDNAHTFMIVGDVLFAGGGIGRTDFSYSNSQDLKQSLDVLLSYPDTMMIYPGHGEPTTVAEEKKYHGG